MSRRDSLKQFFGSMAILLGLIAFPLSGKMDEKRDGLDLVVYCDVSTSLKLEAILSEADDVFRLINNRDFFPAGRFAIFIADRDVEREPPLRGEKVAQRRAADAVEQVRQLNQLRDRLRNNLADYCKRRPVRDKTCIVKAVRSVPRLFHSDSSNQSRRLLIVSDMLEDCHGQGDPKTETQLQSHVDQSLKEYHLPELNGVDVMASVVSSATEPLDMETLRTVWQKALENTHATFSIGTMDALLNSRTSHH